MPQPEQLLQRIDKIAASLRDSGEGLALIGVGSSGAQTARLDEYSDIDFFAIVRAGSKQAFLADIGWLTRVAPAVFTFRDSENGYKLLFADGIYCEFALFEPDEVADVPYSAGRLVWHADGYLPPLAKPPAAPATAAYQTTPWRIGEISTNLYVGMLRYLRGERLSAVHYVEHYANARIRELAPLLEEQRAVDSDVFGGERRFEARFPGMAARLGAFMQGYERVPQSAAAILGWLDATFGVDPAMKSAILALIERAEQK